MVIGDLFHGLLRKRDYEYYINKARGLFDAARAESDPEKKVALVEQTRQVLVQAMKYDNNLPDAYIMRAEVWVAFQENDDDLVCAKQDLQLAIRVSPASRENVEKLLSQVTMRLSHSRAL